MGVGEKHVEAYESHPQCEVVALCDFSKKNLDPIRQKYPRIELVEQANKILSDKNIDIVSIASYDNYHYEQIIKAIENEKHVFVEKPLCLYENEARDIRKALGRKPHLRLSSNLILRKSPRFRKLKDFIGEGKMGTLYYLEGDYNYGRLHKLTDGWRGDIDFYSVVYGGGVHIIDLMLWLTRDTVIEVFGYGNNICTKGTKFRHNDMVVAVLKFKSGMLGKITANFGCVYPHFHIFSAYGSSATFINNSNEYALLYNSKEPSDKPDKLEDAYKGMHKGSLVSGFIDSILDGGKGDISAEDVFKSMSVCFAIERSLSRGTPQVVEYI